MNVLVLNCGSSSVKFQLVRVGRGNERSFARGLVERIGGQALITLKSAAGERERHVELVRDHQAGIEHVLRWLASGSHRIDGIERLADVHAVGHRVVHGGERFQHPVRVDAGVIEGIEDCIELAPLHNPANLRGIRAAAELLGADVPQVAVFDTAFHSTMPEASYIYAIPYQYYRRHRVRRYGFHGTSHQYLAGRYAQLVGREPQRVTLITLHLGNGCSACAVRDGRSFATSMGFTPLEGLVMGTRSGDLDPSLVEFLMLKESMGAQEVDAMLNRQSGLLGISGLTGDVRELLEEESAYRSRRVRLALEIFCNRIRHYIGGYFAQLGGAKAVVFSGGIGENAAEIRRRVCDGLDALGLRLDPERNERAVDGAEGRISVDGCALEAWVVPTDEERLIARETARVIEGCGPADPADRHARAGR